MNLHAESSVIVFGDFMSINTNESYIKCRVYTVDVDEDCKDIGSYFTLIDEVCKNAVVE